MNEKLLSISDYAFILDCLRKYAKLNDELCRTFDRAKLHKTSNSIRELMYDIESGNDVLKWRSLIVKKCAYILKDIYRKDFERYLEETHDLSPFYFDRREDGSYYDELIEVAYQCWIKAWCDGWNEIDRIVNAGIA